MTSLRRNSFLAGSLFLCLFLAVLPLRAQSTAALQGTVTDQSGAVVPGATLTIRDTATGVTRTVHTDSDGNYAAPSLIPGPYTIDVTANGMQTRHLEGLTLNVNVTITENVTLTVGSTQQVINVNASAPVIDTAGITVGQVIDQKTVQNAPLNG